MGGFGLTYCKNKQKNLHEQLNTIVQPYCNWYNDRGSIKNEQAKEAIIKFYETILHYHPLLEYIEKRNPRNLYLIHLYAFHKALKNKLYMRACNELEEFIYFHEVLQGRVYYNLITIIENDLINR